MLVEHFVTSETQSSTIGNIYLGRVQNVLASMEAAFIDIGTGRNAVLYAGEMNWHSEHLHSKNRKMEQALRAGDYILVQVLKDPLGHKGARLTNRISFAGRYLVYFPGGTTAGISRKLPEDERRRLKNILSRVIPEPGGAIIRTAAENVTEEQISDDVNRLHKLWEKLEKEEAEARKNKNGKPVALYEEPNMLVKVVRDLFNEDFSELLVDGEKSWKIVRDYVGRLAPELKQRVHKWQPEQHGGEDVFAAHELDEQLTKALARKVWLPSGGHLIIDRTEAMTVIDVNTGSFIGRGGDLEETLTQNNLEAAEEIVRQMRLRDMGGMIVVDFIDMVLEENQDLVLRRLTEYLGRDRTHHKVSEVTSLGLVQITRKRQGTGLIETFSTVCEACDGRGIIIHADPVEHDDEHDDKPRRDHGNRKERQQAKRQQERQQEKQNGQTNEPKNNRSRRSRSRRGGQNEHGQNSGQESIQDIAAKAVKHADHVDPEEPSGADYVAKQGEHNSKDNQDKQAVHAGQRRVRRVVRRRAVSSSQSSNNSQQNQPEGQSFEEAKKEFDNSPRRRRRTRGNSRSDVPPRPEDFGQQQDSASRGRRRGRRVVRRTS